MPFIPAASTGGGGGAAFVFDGVNFSNENGGPVGVELTLDGTPITGTAFALAFISSNASNVAINTDEVSLTGSYFQAVTSAGYWYLYMIFYPGSAISISISSIGGSDTYYLNVVLPDGSIATSDALALPPPPG